jgi:photosystem II stability/assembly factor-like uncharacterized protein
MQLRRPLLVLALSLPLGCSEGTIDAAPSLDDVGSDAPAAESALDDTGTASIDSGADAALDVPSTPAKRTVFMAQGHVGRTIMSCDDGKSWIRDVSDDDATRCWGPAGEPTTLECDHQPTAGHGITFGDGYFFTNFGWGYNGSLRRSRDGITWETMRTDGWGPGVAYAAGSLVLMWSWSMSTDDGKTFTSIPASMHADFDVHGLTRVGDTIIAIANGGGAILLTSDGGKTWSKPDAFPLDGGAVSESSFARGPSGSIVAVGAKVVKDQPTVAFALRSTDGGKTWTRKELFTSADGSGSFRQLVFTGSELVTFSDGQKWSSADGVAWSSKPVVTGLAVQEGPVAWANGTFVSIRAAWDNFYEKQRAFRSADGITWEQLDAAHFKGGHPLSRIVVAEVDANVCD